MDESTGMKRKNQKNEKKYLKFIDVGPGVHMGILW